VYGIKSNMDQLEMMKAEQAAKQQALADERAGFVSRKELLALGKDYDFAGKASEGSFEVKVKGATDTDAPSIYHAMPRRKEGLTTPKTQAIETVDANGKPVTRFVEPKPGAEFPAFVKPRDASAADTRREDARDERFKSAIERKTAEHNRIMGNIEEETAAANRIPQLVEAARAGNAMASNVLGVTLARAAGEKGVLTDADAQRYGGSQGFVDRFNRYVERSVSGSATDEDLQFAQDFARIMTEAAERRKEQKTTELVHQFTRARGGDFAENYATITGRDYQPPAPRPAAASPAPAAAPANTSIAGGPRGAENRLPQPQTMTLPSGQQIQWSPEAQAAARRLLEQQSAPPPSFGPPPAMGFGRR